MIHIVKWARIARSHHKFAKKIQTLSEYIDEPYDRQKSFKHVTVVENMFLS